MNCGEHLLRSKNKPSTLNHIVIFSIAIMAGVLCYFLSIEIFLAFLIILLIIVSAYFYLGLIDAYYPKKLLPADESGVLYISKPTAEVSFGNEIPDKLEQYDMLTVPDKSAVLLCTKIDFQNNIVYCYFIKNDTQDIFNKSTTLLINGKKAINCTISPIE